MQRKLAQQIEWEKEKQRRAEEAAAALARKIRPKTQGEIDQSLALFAAAKALAVLQGSKDQSVADLRECRMLSTPLQNSCVKTARKERMHAVLSWR